MVLEAIKPFGGTQFVLVGDFWQLSPVTSAIDAGHFAFMSEIFCIAFPHRFELTNIIRQDDSQKSLRNALEDLRYARCTEESELYLQNLSRGIQAEGTLNLFFKRLPVEIHNFNVLLCIPGRMFTLHAEDKGNIAKLDLTIGKTIHLKEGCKVMLLYNISEDLRNGSTGVLCKVEEDNLTVNFHKVGKKQITRQTWYSYERSGEILGSRTQFPIVPSYAVTVHKSQGMTLDGAVVHCSKEFVPGQTYVAMSRVKKEDQLQVVGFRKSFLLPLPKELLNFDPSHCTMFLENQTCCRNQIIGENGFLVHDREDAVIAPDPEDATCMIYELQESAARAYYEGIENAEPASLEDALIALDEMTNKLSSPPESFDHQKFLQNFLFNHDDLVSNSINEAVQLGLTNLNHFKLLICIIWCRIFMIFKELK